MKKFNILVIFILLIAFTPYNSYSDSWYKVRSSCKWWRKKYKTDAKIKKNGSWSYHDYDKGCTWSKSFNSASDYDCNGNYFVAAEAYAYAGDNQANTNWTYVGYCQNWTAGYDVDYYSPKYSIVPLIEYSEYDNNNIYSNIKFGSKVTTQDIIWDYENNKIILKGITMELSVSPKNIANNYAVVMIRVEGAENDDKESSNTVFWESKVFIYNGELIFDGEFLKSNPFRVKKRDIGNYVLEADSIVFNMNNKSFEDKSIDDFQVASYSDVGNLAIGIPDIYAIDFKNNKDVQAINKKLLSISEFNFTIFPNPVSEVLNVETSTNENMIFNISIVDLSGISVLKLGKSEVSKGTYSLTYDLSKLPSGVYFLQFANEKQTYYKKFIKH